MLEVAFNHQISPLGHAPWTPRLHPMLAARWAAGGEKKKQDNVNVTRGSACLLNHSLSLHLLYSVAESCRDEEGTLFFFSAVTSEGNNENAQQNTRNMSFKMYTKNISKVVSRRCFSVCRMHSLWPPGNVVAKDPEGPLPRLPSLPHLTSMFNLTNHLADSSSFHSPSNQEI